MDIFTILLVATNTAALDMVTVESSQATAFKCQQKIEWKNLPTETKDGITYWRLVSFNAHLEKNMGVKISDVAGDKPVWAPAKSKGVVVLTGNNWRETLDKAGYSDAKPKEPSK